MATDAKEADGVASVRRPGFQGLATVTWAPSANAHLPVETTVERPCFKVNHVPRAGVYYTFSWHRGSAVGGEKEGRNVANWSPDL